MVIFWRWCSGWWGEGNLLAVICWWWWGEGDEVKVMRWWWWIEGDFLGVLRWGWWGKGNLLRVLRWCWWCEDDMVMVVCCGWWSQWDVMRVTCWVWWGENDYLKMISGWMCGPDDVENVMKYMAELTSANCWGRDCIDDWQLCRVGGMLVKKGPTILWNTLKTIQKNVKSLECWCETGSWVSSQGELLSSAVRIVIWFNGRIWSIQ